jgi:hypothetical protein
MLGLLDLEVLCRRFKTLSLTRVLRRFLENYELSAEVFVNLEYAGAVAKAVAVVRGTPDCTQLTLKQDLVTSVTQLMSPHYVLDPVQVKKPLDYVPSKQEACPSG